MKLKGCSVLFLHSIGFFLTWLRLDDISILINIICTDHFSEFLVSFIFAISFIIFLDQLSEFGEKCFKSLVVLELDLHLELAS